MTDVICGREVPGVDAEADVTDILPAQMGDLVLDDSLESLSLKDRLSAIANRMGGVATKLVGLYTEQVEKERRIAEFRATRKGG